MKTHQNKKNEMICRDLLFILPLDDLIEICNREKEYEIEDIHDFLIHYSSFITQMTTYKQSAYELSKSGMTKLSYGIPLFDIYFPQLQGNGIIEIAGEAGSGKSQLCMQIITLALLYNKISCYYITDKRFLFSERLKAMETYFCHLLDLQPVDVCSQLNVAKVDSYEEFQSVIRHLDSLQSNDSNDQNEEKDKTKLIIIDCIGSLFRNSFEDKYDKRSEGINWTGTHLIDLINKGNIVITTNEAVDKIDQLEFNAHYDFLSLYTPLEEIKMTTGLDINCEGKSMTTPSGNHWAYFVTHRLFLFKTNQQFFLRCRECCIGSIVNNTFNKLTLSRNRPISHIDLIQFVPLEKR